MTGKRAKKNEPLKTKQVAVRLRQDEYDFIFELAKDQRTSAAVLIRDTIFNPDVRKEVNAKFKTYAAAAEIAKILESDEVKNDNTD